jgi:DNA-binding MarR family transcriptional regulator
MEDSDEIIHQSTRLRIMSTLNALRGHESLDFVQLRQVVRTTDGNLGGHLATLEKAGYVAIEKDFVGKKPRTRISITRAGRRAFERHVQFLQDILHSDSRIGSPAQ